MSAQQFVICPKCQTKLDVDPSWAGRRVRCKRCRNEFELQTSSMMARSPRSLERLADTSPDSANETILGPSRTQSIRETSVDIANRGTFSRFELIELLGEGAFGKVYKARDPNLARLVALKIPTFSAAELKKTSRFLDEAKSAAALRHKNIVPIYEAGMFEGRPYIVSEFIEGETLSHRIGADPVSYRTAATWIRDLALALQYAHENGIIHRDVKSENIMVDAKQVPFLMDFGLAKRLHEDSTRTLDGTVLGTPAYMPPEQARGDQKMIGPRSDQYSLAVVLYELLCRQRPFSGPPHSVLAQVMSAQPRLPSAILRGVPKHLEAICLKAMSKDIEARYPSASKFAADLDCYLAGQVPIAYRRKLPFRLPKLNRKYQNFVSTASVLVALLFCGVVAWRFKTPTAKRSTEALVLKPKSLASPSNLALTKSSVTLKLIYPAEGASYTLDGEAVTASQLTKPLELPIGMHSISARLGDDELFNEAFEAKANTSVTVELRDYDRKAAMRTLELGGNVGISVQGEPLTVEVGQPLPPTLFRVTYLHLWGTQLSDIDLSVFAPLKEISGIGLSRSSVTDKGLRYFHGMPNLIDVQVSYTRVTESGLEGLLSTLESLRTLTMEGLPVTDRIMAQLDKHPLETFWASGSKIGDDGLAHLKNAPLRICWLGDTPITDRGLVYFTGKSFESLVLEDTFITDAGIEHLKKCKRIDFIDLTRSKVTDKGVASLQKAFPECKMEY